MVQTRDKVTFSLQRINIHTGHGPAPSFVLHQWRRLLHDGGGLEFLRPQEHIVQIQLRGVVLKEGKVGQGVVGIEDVHLPAATTGAGAAGFGLLALGKERYWILLE